MSWTRNICVSLTIAIGLIAPASAIEPYLGTVSAIQSIGTGGWCSAVHLGDGHFATAGHCFDPVPNNPVTMQVKLGLFTGYFRGKLDDVDIAFFYIPEYTGPAAKVSCTPVKLWQRIWSESFPPMLSYILTDGKVIGLSLPNEILTDMIIVPGSSGAGVFNEDNELIGISSAIFRYNGGTWGNLSFVSPIVNVPELCSEEVS